MIYFNEKTLCCEYPDGKVKETFEQRLNRKLIREKLRMEIGERKIKTIILED